jgi:23S rRNA U2552 (ribose-2'-O)-methylase RlmE/FtsJ
MPTIRQIFFNDLTLGSDKWDPYFDVYETYFQKFVGRAPIVMEVGVQSGGSMQLWRKYFGPEAQIWGVDIDPNILQHGRYYDDKIRLIVGDQAKPDFWDTVFALVPEIDVFIDDGGHMPMQQRVTFECVFPRLRNGGVFICEDTHTAYIRHVDASGRRAPHTFVNYAKNLADLLSAQFLEEQQPDDQRLLRIIKGLSSVHFYNSMVVMEKEQLKPFGITDNKANVGREL